MVTEHFDDGEGEILRARARGDRQGPAAGGQPRPARQCHARNGRARRRADRLPHLPAMSTWPRPAAPPQSIWRCCWAAKQSFAKAFRQLPFLIPISWQCTNDQPSKASIRSSPRLQGDAGADPVVRAGFSGRGFCRLRTERVRLWPNPGRRRSQPRTDIAALIESHEDDFDGRIYTPDEGVRHAHGAGEDRDQKPIVIADTQDNPGAGGIPTPPACCARWCATMPPKPPSA